MDNVLEREDDFDEVKAIEAAVERLGSAKTEIERIIFGQGDVVERSLIAVLCGGHALLVGVPGSPRRASSRRWAPCWG